MSFTRSTLIDFQTVLAPLVKTSNVQFYKKPNAGSRLGSAINAPFTRSGAGRKVIDASGNLVDAAANVPAWTFPIGGSSAGCPYLSFLPSVENIVSYSEDYDLGNWQQVGLTKLSEYSKLGLNFFEFQTGAASTGASNHLRDLSLTFSASDYTFSGFIDLDKCTSDFIAFRVSDNVNDARFSIKLSTFSLSDNGSGIIVDSGYRELNNNVIHFYVTATMAAVSGNGFFVIYPSNAGNGSIKTDAAVNFAVSGLQVKQGSYISPLDYVKTEASAVTRSVDQITDIADLQTAGYLPSASEGAIMFQVGFDSVEASGTSNAFTFEDGSNNDVFGLRTSTTGVQIYDYVNAAVADTITDQGGLHRVVISFSTTQIDIAVDGFDEYSASGDFSIQDLEDMLADVGLNVKMLNFDPTTQTSNERQAASSWPSFDLMVSDLGYS